MDVEIFAKPGYLINRSARLLARWGDGRFRALGLAIAQVPVLAALKDGVAKTQKELAQLVQIEQPTMAQLLARMERDGLVRRNPDPKDKRSSKVSLTPIAQKKLPAARAVLLQGNAAALQGFTDREVATLSRLLTRVVNNLAAATEDSTLAVPGASGKTVT
jgi:DNA-binding MarR family transcriptional regulator